MPIPNWAKRLRKLGIKSIINNPELRPSAIAEED
jgi:hypothetical protein